MTLNSNTSGVFPIAPTPFDGAGCVDQKSIGTLIEKYLLAGAAGVTVLGIMGEAPKLEPAESLAIASDFVRGFGKHPVIVGVSAPGFAAMASLAKGVMDLGAAGVMVAPQPHLRTDEQIVAYFRQAVEAIGGDTPFVIQDYPLTLSVQMAPRVIREIAQEHASCVMLKHEDWPGLEKISTLRRFQQQGSMKPISILTGNGGLFLDFEMERGADGAMTGYAFPEMLVGVAKLQRDGKRDAAHDLFDAHLPLLRYEQQPNVGLAVRKYVLMKRGFIASDALRMPGSALTSAAKAEIDYLLRRLERSDPGAKY